MSLISDYNDAYRKFGVHLSKHERTHVIPTGPLTKLSMPDFNLSKND